MIGKIIGITVCFAAIIAQTNAQEFGVELSGGLQGMYYPLKNGQTKLLPAGSLGLNYTFRLSSQLGVLTGITGGLYRTQITLQDGQIITYDAVDDVGSAFQSRVKFTGYKEIQRFLAVSIPLLLQYQTGGSGKQWYINGGAKLFIPFNASTQVSAKQVSLTGYYPDFNVEVSDLPQHGFGTLNNWRSTCTLTLKPAAALSAGTGMIFSLSPGRSLYAGVFVDYGLTNLKSKSDTPQLVTYSSNATNGAQANSVLNTDNAGRATLLSFGLQIRLSFGHSREKPVARPGTAGQTQKTAQPQIAVRSDTVSQTQKAPEPQKNESAPPVAAPATTALTSDEAAIVNEPVVFGILGEASIPESQKSHLDEVANLLKRYSNIRLSIVGHYCNSITETENRKVGEARAKAVARYLQGKGIPRSRMNISAAIESDPVQSGDPAANYNSRRVVITEK